jgi:hypothetical protein
MVDADKKERVLGVFKLALDVLKEEGIFPKAFVGKIVLNCNNGGVNAIDLMDTIRSK